MVVPIVEEQKCNGCERCADVCPPQAIVIEGGKAKIDERICEECGECVTECPEEAISLPERR